MLVWVSGTHKKKWLDPRHIYKVINMTLIRYWDDGWEGNSWRQESQFSGLTVVPSWPWCQDKGAGEGEGMYLDD